MKHQSSSCTASIKIQMMDELHEALRVGLIKVKIFFGLPSEEAPRASGASANSSWFSVNSASGRRGGVGGIYGLGIFH